jgi:Ser/Thr protein kinase RdoA (MazF antagonist)
MVVELRHVLAPDSSVPARDVLLDPALVADRLAASLGVDGPLHLDRCELQRAKYRIGESLRVVYRLETGGRVHRIAARTFAAGTSAEVHRRAVAAAVPTGTLRPVLHDPTLTTVWWTFPNDRRLRGLDPLVRAAPEVSGLVGTRWKGSEPVELAPERSATLRAHDRGDTTLAYLKVYAPGSVRVDELAARYRRLATAMARAATLIDIPSAPNSSAERAVLVLAPMPGLSWHRVGAAVAPAALRRLGEGIATLHGLLGTVAGPGGDGRCELRPFARLQPARLARSLDLIGMACPGLADRAAGVGARLAGGAPTGEPVVLLHGDCHPGNALFDGSRLALIDLDQAAAGPAAADVGSLLARLRSGAVIDEPTPIGHDELAAAFLDGYRAVRELPPARSLAWHTAAALVAERALRAVNRVVPAALDRIDGLLEAADDTLRTGGF